MGQKQVFSLLVTFLVGGILWFVPHPTELSLQAWHLFSIFVATILGIILKPFPIGAMSILAMSVATLTKTLSLQEALAGFHNEIAWLVVFAFFISRGFINTGLGSRISYYFVALFGRKTLGLSYGLLTSELILAPAIPSVTARAGGVIFPIAQGLSRSFGSDPVHRTERRIGSFLIFSAYQGSAITSAMFLTAMAANPFLTGLTEEAGFSITWGKWALAAILPGMISLIVMPLVLYKLYPPIIKDTPDAAKLAREKLKEMGRFTRKEGIMLIIFLLLIFLWVFGSFVNLSATIAAMVGLSLLLFLNVLTWKDVTHEDKAWDTFIWFSILIMLASALNKYGFTPWLSERVVELVRGMSWIPAFLILFLVYFYSHYFFASNTAHVGAMYPAFLMVGIGLGAPVGLVINSLAFASSLMGGLTHYGSGPAPLYYGSGYVDIKSWWKYGFIISLVNIFIWIGLGSIWWKFLGYY